MPGPAASLIRIRLMSRTWGAWPTSARPTPRSRRKLDRLARSSRDLHNIIHELKERGCGFVSLGENWCDTTTDIGRLMLTIMGGMNEFERGLIRQRCQAGIERAKARARNSAARPCSILASARKLPSAMPQVRQWPSLRATMIAARQRFGGRCGLLEGGGLSRLAGCPRQPNGGHHPCVVQFALTHGVPSLSWA
jgi:resolvase-like protein